MRKQAYPSFREKSSLLVFENSSTRTRSSAQGESVQSLDQCQLDLRLLVRHGGDAEPCCKPVVRVATPPLAFLVVRLVLEAHGDTIGGVAPQLLPQPVVELPRPLTPQELLDGLASLEELVAVAPLGVFGVGRRDRLGSRVLQTHSVALTFW